MRFMVVLLLAVSLAVGGIGWQAWEMNQRYDELRVSYNQLVSLLQEKIDHDTRFENWTKQQISLSQRDAFLRNKSEEVGRKIAELTSTPAGKKEFLAELELQIADQRDKLQTLQNDKPKELAAAVEDAREEFGEDSAEHRAAQQALTEWETGVNENQDVITATLAYADNRPTDPEELQRVQNLAHEAENRWRTLEVEVLAEQQVSARSANSALRHIAAHESPTSIAVEELSALLGPSAALAQETADESSSDEATITGLPLWVEILLVVVVCIAIVALAVGIAILLSGAFSAAALAAFVGFVIDIVGVILLVFFTDWISPRPGDDGTGSASIGSLKVGLNDGPRTMAAPSAFERSSESEESESTEPTDGRVKSDRATGDYVLDLEDTTVRVRRSDSETWQTLFQLNQGDVEIVQSGTVKGIEFDPRSPTSQRQLFIELDGQHYLLKADGSDKIAQSQKISPEVLEAFQKK